MEHDSDPDRSALTSAEITSKEITPSKEITRLTNRHIAILLSDLEDHGITAAGKLSVKRETWRLVKDVLAVVLSGTNTL